MCFSGCIKQDKTAQKKRTYPPAMIYPQPANSPKRESKITDAPEISENALRALLIKRINELTEESNK